ncbi:MAG TPA: NUDIX domain-containing protein [Gemmatimonadales bacterium]|nr:NUDIX domain-containing protein [Gemmatimonadales bacterium]
MPLIRQAGSIVVRMDGKEPEVLLVTAKRNPRNWIFPKGHIEKGETPEAAALRETKEEAGIVGKLIGPAGALEYGFLGAKARVDYFLVQFKREAGPPEDGRQRSWCKLEEALDRLNYKNTRKLLRKAWKQLSG